MYVGLLQNSLFYVLKRVFLEKFLTMDYSFNICLKNRQQLEKFLTRFTPEQLNKIPEGFNNNIIWNIGHTLATQQLLTYGLSELTPNLSLDFINTYKKGTKPGEILSDSDITAMKNLLFSTLEDLEKDYRAGTFKTYKEYTLSTTGGVLSKIEHAIEFNNFHEGLHLGCCIALSKFV